MLVIILKNIVINDNNNRTIEKVQFYSNIGKVKISNSNSKYLKFPPFLVINF